MIFAEVMTLRRGIFELRIPLTHYVWDLVVFRLVCLRLCLFIYRIAVQLFWAANGKRERERERERARLRTGKGWG